LREQMKKVFGIENFRLAQEGYAIFTIRTAPVLSIGNTACATQIWTEETSFASCPLVSVLSLPELYRLMDHCSPRGREISNIPATCDANARLHPGYLTPCIPHEGSITPFARKR
jgi:hypothetical protein